MKQHGVTVRMIVSLMFVGFVGAMCLLDAGRNSGISPKLFPSRPGEFIRKIKWLDYAKYLVGKGEDGAIAVAKNSQKRVDSAADNLFKVKILDVTGLARLSKERIINTVSREGNVYVRDILRGAIKERLGQDAWIRDFRVQWRIFPLGVIIDIEEEEPWLVAEYNNESWLIGRGGNIIESLRELEKMDVVVESSRLVRIGGIDQKIDEQTSLIGSNTRLKAAVSLAELIEKAGGFPFLVEEYSLLDDGGFRIQPREAGVPEVLMAPDSIADVKKKIEELKIVLDDLHTRGESAKSIDLRFSRQAVVR